MLVPPPELQIVLRRMAQLLRDDVFEGYAGILFDIADVGWRTSDEGFRKIASLYGGMGSLNDVVLQKDGMPHAAENEEFARLRSQLFDLARSMSNHSRRQY